MARPLPDLVLRGWRNLGPCIREVRLDEQLEIPVKNLRKYINAAQKGTFVPDREKDELTMALGNPEHPGRT